MTSKFVEILPLVHRQGNCTRRQGAPHLRNLGLSFILGALLSLALSLLSAPAPVIAQESSVAADAPRLRLLHDVVGPGETIYVAVENAPAAKSGPMPAFTIVKNGAVPHFFLYLHIVAPVGEFDRWYSLPPQEEGQYELRLNRAYEVIASVPFRVAGGPRVFKTAFADTLLDYSAAGASPFYEEPFGMLDATPQVQPVDPAIVLGDPGPGPFSIRENPKLQFLALPQGSSVTVGFSEVLIVDGPGPDLLVRTVEPRDSAGEFAEVHVSTDLREFHKVSRIYEGDPQLLDLEGLKLPAPVIAVRVTGLDLRGRIPGFDLISVEALNFEAFNPAPINP